MHGGIYGYMLIATGFAALHQKFDSLVSLCEEVQFESLYYNKWFTPSITKIYNPIYATADYDDELISQYKAEYGSFILMVARFDAGKDHYTVIDSIKNLREAYGQTINAVFCGDGVDFEKVKMYCRDTGISDHIFFAGAVANTHDYYAAAEILVHSSAVEGLPTVLLEAMTHGKPIIASDNMGAREIIGASEYGLICKYKDVNDMTEKVLYLLEDVDAYEYYKARGYERIKDFHPDVIKEQLEKLLSSLS